MNIRFFYSKELWDGKLRSTVKSFTKKIVKDMSLRNHLQNSMPLLPAGMPSQRSKLKVEDSVPSRASKTVPIPPVPSWSRWTDGNLVQRLVQCYMPYLCIRILCMYCMYCVRTYMH